ncbi:MAG TPA: hypothetical protein VHH36_05595 [Candidatus Thermoplasmatota archaeon]|nr:hypothetical protein [Candidatus Thermoplasmatota archaeon]
MRRTTRRLVAVGMGLAVLWLGGVALAVASRAASERAWGMVAASLVLVAFLAVAGPVSARRAWSQPDDPPRPKVPPQRGRPPPSVGLLVGIAGALALLFAGAALFMAMLAMDPDAPILVTGPLVALCAAIALASGRFAWGLLRGMPWAGERALAAAQPDGTLTTRLVFGPLAQSDAARRWFRLPPRT